MKSRNLKRKGFTLIELIAAIAILAIAMIGIGTAVSFGSKVNAKNEKKVNTSDFAQYVIQTYKSKGENNIKALYNGSSYSGYYYFNNINELDAVISGTNNNLIQGTYSNMLNGSAASNKNYGVYVEFATTNVLGKITGTSTDLALQSGFDDVRIYVKVENLKEVGMNDSSLVLYLGR